MKKLLLTLIACILFSGCAQEPTEVKVYFASWHRSEYSDSGSPQKYDESTPIYEFIDWFQDKNGESARGSETTIQAMYDEGWKLAHVTKTNASAETWQLMLVFERDGGEK